MVAAFSANALSVDDGAATGPVLCQSRAAIRGAAPLHERCVELGANGSGSPNDAGPRAAVSIVTRPVFSPAASSSYQGSGRSPNSSRT